MFRRHLAAGVRCDLAPGVHASPRIRSVCPAKANRALAARTFWHAVCLIICVDLFSATSYADTPEQIADLKQSLLFVSATSTSGSQSTEETGSGFVITASGYALTANHIVAAPGVKIVVSIGSRFGPKIPAALVPTGQDYTDVALLQLPATLAPYHPVRFGDWSRLSPGGGLLAVGFPLQSDVSPATGILAGFGGPEGLWQVQIPLNYGNSGGPVANGAGRVIGMVRGGVADAQQVNYIIPLNRLAPVLIIAGLKWPPFDTDEGAAPVPRPLLTTTTSTALPQLGQTGPGFAPSPPTTIPPNCTEVTDVAAGLPPTYTKRLECK
jgi:S1-C subfamily serine protease